MAESALSRKLLCPDCGEIYSEGDYEHCPEDGTPLTAFVIDSEPADDPLIGEELDDRFVIEEVLGEGSMGRVYRATQRSVDRSVAVKTVHPRNATDEETVKRFHREARAISEFAHPNIVKLVDFGQDLERGTLYLAMEYIDGYPVRQLVARGRLAPEFAVSLGVQIAGALAEVHSHGLVHRDVKPDNLMIVPLADGRVEAKLLDFGIAHALRESKNLTETGAVFGTPHFISPEQAEAEEVGPYSDVYSLGAVLFEMLTGRHPVDAEDPMEVMVGHVQGRIPTVTDVLGRGAISDHLNWLVGNMLSTRPEERPGDILRVRDVLKTIASLEEYETPEVDPSLDRESMFEPFVVEVEEKASETTEPAGAGSDGRRDGGDAEVGKGGVSAEAARLPPESFEPPPESTSGNAGGRASREPARDSDESVEEGGDGSSASGSGSAPGASGSSDRSYQPTLTGEVDSARQTSVGSFGVAAVAVVVVGVAVALYFAFGGGADVAPEAPRGASGSESAPSVDESPDAAGISPER